MIWDLPNLLICFIIIISAQILDKITLKHALCLAFISLVPFCLNYVIFDPHYMPDQFSYWHMLQRIRDFTYTPYNYNVRVTEASFIYAFLPLPFVETINSMGFFNKFLFICIFIWAASALKLRGWVLWFLLFYPSLLLYSSLSLREMLICTLMLLVLWATIHEWYGLVFIALALLFEVKMQNALLVGAFSVLYLATKKISFPHSKFMLLFAVITGCILFYISFPYIGTKIEYYRIRMYLEDGGLLADYQPIKTMTDLFSNSLYGFMPWMAKSSLQFMQAIENIIVTTILLVYTIYAGRLIPKATAFWAFFLLSGLIMYGLIVANVGTLVRYRFPFIVVYLIFLSYELVQYRQQQLMDKPHYA